MTGNDMQPPQHGDEHPVAERSWIARYEYHLEIAGSLIVALLGAILWVVNGRLGRALGANFISAGGVALVVFLAYGQLSRSRRQEQSEDHEATLEEIAQLVRDVKERAHEEGTQVQQAIDVALARSLDAFCIAKEIGLTNFTVGRPKDLNERVLAAKKTVDILEISLNTMQGIGATAWRNCEAKIRIILLDPCFPPRGNPLARLRDAEEHQGDGQILGEIREILETFPQEWFSTTASQAANGPSGQREPGTQRVTPDRGDTGADDPANANGTHVKLAQVMPTMSYFRIDDIAYFAPLVHRRLGHETMHLQLHDGGQLFAALGVNFDTLWADKKHVVPADLSKIPASYPSPAQDYSSEAHAG